MAVTLSLGPAPPPRLEWPENCRLSLSERARIEAEHFAPQERQRDAVGELRSVVVLLEQRIAALERALAKAQKAHNGSIRHLGDAVEGLELLIYGPSEQLPKSKDELAGFEPNLVRMIRVHARTKQNDERIAQLEKRPVYEWKGPHVEGTEHGPGHLVQKGGNVWLCTATTTGVPGKCEDYTLFVRSGRDGRDVREGREPVVK